MLRLVRKASHRITSSINKKNDKVYRTLRTLPPPPKFEATFLGIPAELRNLIYDHVALHTELLLPPVRPRKFGEPAALLLVCRQITAEFRYILLANATIRAQVFCYNFKHLRRVLEDQDARAMKALMSNRNLGIILILQHVPSRKDFDDLKHWCHLRAWDRFPVENIVAQQALEQGVLQSRMLIFHYDVQFSRSMRPPRPAIRYTNGYEMQVDLLRSHVKIIKSLNNKEDDLREVTNHMVKGLEECATILESLAHQRPTEDEYVITSLAA